MINKTSLKFIAGFVAIIGVSLISLYILQTYFSPEGQAKRRLADLQRLYEEDTYGGRTPEETLELLIAALKEGDIELASKYFLPEDREETYTRLLNEKNINGDLGHFLAGLNKLEKTISDDNSRSFFVITNENNLVLNQVTLGKNTNGVWKIVDM